MISTLIKYRAWDTVKKKMWSAEEMGADQFTLSPDGRGFINVSGQSTRMSTYLSYLIPLQYIGLQDKNWTEIYAGDIVTAIYSGDVPIPMRVTWHRAGWLLEDGLVYHTSDWWKPPKATQECEIIGNIYENPDLVDGPIADPTSGKVLAV